MNMTQEKIETMITELNNRIIAADSAAELYRVKRGEMFVSLSNPTDGSKKPSESLILSMIDADPAMSALRTDRDAKQTAVTCWKYYLDSVIAWGNK